MKCFFFSLSLSTQLLQLVSQSRKQLSVDEAYSDAFTQTSIKKYSLSHTLLPAFNPFRSVVVVVVEIVEIIIMQSTTTTATTNERNEFQQLKLTTGCLDSQILYARAITKKV